MVSVMSHTHTPIRFTSVTLSHPRIEIMVGIQVVCARTILHKVSKPGKSQGVIE